MDHPRLTRRERIAASAVCAVVCVGTTLVGMTSYTVSAKTDVTFWLSGFIFAALAFVPWLPSHNLRWRFSLRTLLIVTTLVGAMLGLGVWLVRLRTPTPPISRRDYSH